MLISEVLKYLSTSAYNWYIKNNVYLKTHKQPFYSWILSVVPDVPYYRLRITKIRQNVWVHGELTWLKINKNEEMDGTPRWPPRW